MTAPVHYPSPGDEYVLMPIDYSKPGLTQQDIANAQAFAASQGRRIVRLLGMEDVEGKGPCVVWLAVDANSETLHDVLASVEAEADRHQE